MLEDVFAILLLFGLAVLFIWLATRAFRNRHAYIKWPGVILSGMLALVLIALTAAATRGLLELEMKRSNPPSTVVAATTVDALARGQQLVYGCACHTPVGEALVSGSRDNFLGAGGPPLGVLYAPNLTPGGTLRDWTDGEIARAIREGIGKDGRSLWAMPSVVYRNLSDADLTAVIAYLRSLPPAEVVQEPRNMNVLAHLIVGFGIVPASAQRSITQPQSAPPPAADAEYGRYVAAINTCSDCHGNKLDGVPSNPFTPLGPSLIALSKAWTAEQWITLFREGKLPSGGLVPASMPWSELGPTLSDVDIRALHAYLQTQ